MEINVEKSAMMHMRKKRVDRCAATVQIGMNEIPWVSSYKYLGCVIDEFLDCSEMVEHRVKLGSQAYVYPDQHSAGKGCLASL